MKKDLYEILREEREVSDKTYAVKIVERIVFAFVSMVLVAVIVAILRLVITQ